MADDFAGQPGSIDQTAGADDQFVDEGYEEGAEGAVAGQEDPVVDFDGKQYKASELREYIKGGMLEKDYRQKTSTLAQERRQVEELRRAAEAWQTVQEHEPLMRALGTAISQMLQGGPGLGQQPGQAQEQPEAPIGIPGAIPPQPNPLEGRLSTLEKNLGQVLGAFDQRVNEQQQYLWQQYYANRENYAASQVAQLQSKYPFLVADEVVAAFRDNPNFDLEEIAKTSNEYWQQWYQERQKANMAQRKANASARVAVPGAKAGAPVTQTKQPLEWDDAMRSALERLKKVQ